jgi:hypothetical protein
MYNILSIGKASMFVMPCFFIILASANSAPCQHHISILVVLTKQGHSVRDFSFHFARSKN